MGQAHQPGTGLSEFQSTAMQFEETVFKKILRIAQEKEDEENKRQFDRRRREFRIREAKRELQASYENKIKARIRTVISTYQRRMNPRHHEEIPALILAESKNYGFDPMLLTALIITESSFNNKARSHKGALGLMQILPGTGLAMASEKEMEWKGNPTLYNPETNIALGSYYLKKITQPLRQSYSGPGSLQPRPHPAGQIPETRIPAENLLHQSVQNISGD